MRKKQKNNNDIGVLIIPAGILTGIGIGFLANNLLGGLFLGFGLSFIFFAITELINNKK